MKYRRYGNTLVVRVDIGERLMESLTEVCKKENAMLGSISGLGAVSHVTYGYLDTASRTIIKKEKSGDMEITALIGSVTRLDGQPNFHLHITLADSEQHAWGGHLFEAEVSVTAEVFITLLDGDPINRVFSPEAGINLMDL